jgi:hypothetical protein
MAGLTRFAGLGRQQEQVPAQGQLVVVVVVVVG